MYTLNQLPHHKHALQAKQKLISECYSDVWSTLSLQMTPSTIF